MPIECFANCCCVPCILPCFTGAEGSCCCAFSPPDCCLFHPCLPCITCLLWPQHDDKNHASPRWLQNSKYLPMDLVLEESQEENVVETRKQASLLRLLPPPSPIQQQAKME